MSLFVKEISAQIPETEKSPILLIHGFCEDHTIWENIVPALKHHQVFLVDLPGFGNSIDRLPDDLSIEWVADAVFKEVIEKNAVNPVVIGHSLGGYVALALAEKYAHQLAGICLFHSTAFADSPEKKVTRNKVIDFVKNAGVKTFTSEFVPGLFHSTYRRSNPDQVQKVVDLASTTPLNTLVAYTAAMRDRPDRMQVLKNFEGKKLIIAGDKDGAVPLLQSLSLKDVVGESNFVLLKDTAHMAMFEKPEESCAALTSFF